MSERGLRETLPYLNGAYVAVGAVSDLRLIVDGPYCVVQKAELHMAHDPASGLISASGVGRIGHTDLHLNQNVAYRVTVDRGHDIVRVLSEAASLPDTGLVLLTSMDFHQILAAPLERYRRQAVASGGAPIALLEARSLAAGWLEGYGAVLERVASLAALPQADPEPDTVAVVGLLFDRRAGDAEGNRREVARLIEGLGLRVACVWPDGGPVAGLAAAARARWVVSLPYAREAAARLAVRVGVRVVEAPLPLGLGGTRAFLDEVARATGREEALTRFWEREMEVLIPQVRDHTFRYLSGRRVRVVADPHVAMGLVGLVQELGMELAGLDVMAPEDEVEPDTRSRLREAGARFEPVLGDWPAEGFGRDDDADVVVAPTLFPRQPARAAWLPFGYPNYLVHPIRLTPYLGLEGVRWWVECLTEACQMAETRNAGTPLGGVAEVRDPDHGGTE